MKYLEQRWNLMKTTFQIDSGLLTIFTPKRKTTMFLTSERARIKKIRSLKTNSKGNTCSSSNNIFRMLSRLDFSCVKSSKRSSMFNQYFLIILMIKRYLFLKCKLSSYFRGLLLLRI